MKIAVLGAGLTGLTTAYYLSKNGHQVSVFEKEPAPGGLASTFKLPHWDWPLEYFYHHFFSNDTEAINLIKDLRLEGKLFFPKPLTSTYYRGKISPLDSPISLLKFPHLTLIEKLRTGLILAYLKVTPDYRSLENQTADEWLKKTMGDRSFEILWKPLLAAKFGNFSSQVTAAWFWARIKKRTKSLGYLEGSFQTLTDRLVEKIKENGGEICLNQGVQKIKRQNSKFIIHDSLFDAVISTLPTSIFLKITPNLPQTYQKQLSQIPHLWAQTLILELEESFMDDVYWLNVNDTSFPFLAVVQHTNFIDKAHYGGHHILYIGNYLPNDHQFLSKSTDQLLKIFIPYLKKINPNFNLKSSILNHQLFASPFAQPVITVGHQSPTIQTPIPNLYLANQDCIYPWDRGANYAIELGKKVTRLVVSS